jgi:cation:H+ antiporter
MAILPLVAIAAGLAALVWSADRFVSGAAALARHFGMPALLVGMLVVGFGTSAPEMLVSTVASLQGNPGIALGNAYGSNIANIALILGLTAVLAPVAVHSAVLRRELPILLAVTVLTILLVFDLRLSRLDALVLLGVFAGVVLWSILQARHGSDALGEQFEADAPRRAMPPRAAVLWTLIGLAALVVSSRVLVWGAVETATALGVSDLLIGLTVVAIGTSLPELASSLVAVRRGEHDIALGNVIGSNLFNTLAVVGIAGAIRPIDVPREVLVRDLPVMTGLTFALVVICAGFGGRQGRVNRVEGAALLATFVAYTGYLASTAAG